MILLIFDRMINNLFLKGFRFIKYIWYQSIFYFYSIFCKRTIKTSNIIKIFLMYTDKFVPGCSRRKCKTDQENKMKDIKNSWPHIISMHCWQRSWTPVRLWWPILIVGSLFLQAAPFQQKWPLFIQCFCIWRSSSGGGFCTEDCFCRFAATRPFC